MKRIWIGLVLLLGLLAMGILTMRYTDRQLQGMSETLKQASETGDWSMAIALAEAAQKDWQRKWGLMAVLSDHGKMDTVDGAFAQIKVYQRYKDKTSHASTCALLSEELRDLAENHKLTWRNLL